MTDHDRSGFEPFEMRLSGEQQAGASRSYGRGRPWLAVPGQGGRER